MSVRKRPLEGVSGRSETVSRYDLLLVVLPLPMLLGAAVGSVSALTLHAAVGAGALLSVPLLWYGLFYDAPAGVAGGPREN